MTTNAITRLVIKTPQETGYTFKLVAEYENGSWADFGDIQTERGAKMMLTRRAKQFGLTKQKCGTQAI
jgi:hypothetical protein